MGFGAISELPTKELFIPPIFGTDLSSHSGFMLNAYNEYVSMLFWAPHDFKSIVEAKIICLANATETIDVRCFSAYGAEGESSGTHYATSYPSQDVVDEEFYAIDISDILTALLAGDHVKIEVRRVTDHDVMNAYVRGILLKYA